jgi:hypothetical protein
VGRTGSSLRLFAEVFNLFNSDNLVGCAGDISTPVTFGQPGGGFSQVFGSGGPPCPQRHKQ